MLAVVAVLLHVLLGVNVIFARLLVFGYRPSQLYYCYGRYSLTLSELMILFSESYETMMDQTTYTFAYFIVNLARLGVIKAYD